MGASEADGLRKAVNVVGGTDGWDPEKATTALGPRRASRRLRRDDMEFNENNPITVFEHWFSSAVPVARGRFIFSHLGKYDYDFAECGPVRKSSARMQKQTGKLIYRTWEVADILPRGRPDYQEDVDAAEPRVSAVMRSFNGFPVISDWEGLGRKYQEVAFKPSFFNSTRKLKAKADGLCKGQAAPEAKAQAIFQWVEDSISYKATGLSSIDPDKVIASGQGNMWETAVVLREMFEHAALKTEVKEVFQKMLTQIGTSNALTACKVSGQNSRGKPLSAKLTFRNPNQVVEWKGEMQMRLSHLFHAYFASYDTSRSAGFKQAMESMQVVRLEVAKIPGRRLDAERHCTETDNALFKTTCSFEDTPVDYVFTRVVLLRKAKLSAREMRALYPRIVELNRIGEGRLVVRGEGGKKSAKGGK